MQKWKSKQENINKDKNAKTKQPKSSQKKIELGYFYAGQVLLHMGLPWSVVNVLSDTPLGKIDFPLANGSQLQIAS